MQITKEFGQEIISRVSEYVEIDIYIMNLEGVVVASTDSNYIGHRPKSALKVIETQEPVSINSEEDKSRRCVYLPVTLRNKIVGVVGVGGKPVNLEQVTGLIRASVEIVLEQLCFHKQAYDRERRWNHWLHQLLNPNEFDEEALEEEAIYFLHLDVNRPWRVLLIRGRNCTEKIEEIRRIIQHQVTQLLFVSNFLQKEVIVAFHVNDEKAKNIAQDIIQELNGNARIGIGEIYKGIRGIRDSYEEAKQVLTLSSEVDTISFSKDWTLARLVSSIPKEDFNRICLQYKKDLDQLEAYYIDTIDTYFNYNFSIKDTADALHIHRNTLLYRLQQVKDRVGLDPRNLHDALLITIIRYYKH